MNRVMSPAKTVRPYCLLHLLIWFVGVCVISACAQEPRSSSVNVLRLAPLGEPPAKEILWSPVDRNELLISGGYADFTGGKNYILDLDTGEQQILAQSDYGILSVRTWSRDGSSIVMAAEKNTTGFEQGGLWIIRISDRSLSRIQANTNRIIWGPNDDQLTIVRTRQDESGHEFSELVLINLTSEEETVLFVSELKQIILGLSWSPNGEQLAFSMGSAEPKQNFNIYILDMKSKGTKQITQDGDNTQPSWSPVDELIIYRRKTIVRNQEVFSLQLIRSSGICDLKLYESSYLLSPSWSPDGTHVAFVEPNAQGIFAADLTNIVSNGQINGCQ